MSPEMIFTGILALATYTPVIGIREISGFTSDNPLVTGCQFMWNVLRGLPQNA